MGTLYHSDWDPQSLFIRTDQIALYDQTRRRCPVAHSELLGWSLFRHEDVRRVLHDPATFSSAVSAHLTVPNGMDPPRHTAYRRIVDSYFAHECMAMFEPRCRRIASELVTGLPHNAQVELMSQFAEDFALQAQCAFLGWPVQLHEALREWTRKNHAAIRRQDRHGMAAVAFEFDGHIRQVLAAHRQDSDAFGDDVVGRLLGEQIHDRRLTDEEIVSILRNWTVGELATISACVGIVAYFLAARGALQSQLRTDPTLLPVAIEEILRIHAPLMTSRRITTAPVELDGRTIEAGERITIMWSSANRDERAFENPEEFRLDRDSEINLLYGAGIHVCPGAPLARLELRVLFEELVARAELAPVQDRPPTHAMYPSAGFSECPLQVRRIAR